MATLLVQDQVMKVLLWNCVESLEFSSSNQIMFAYSSASSTNKSENRWMKTLMVSWTIKSSQQQKCIHVEICFVGQGQTLQTG